MILVQHIVTPLMHVWFKLFIVGGLTLSPDQSHAVPHLPRHNAVY